MQQYQLGSGELASKRLLQASDKAWAYIGRNPYFRIQQGKSLVGCIPRVTERAAEERSALGRSILDLLGSFDRELLTHDEQLTWHLLHYYAQGWAKDAERYWLAFDASGVLFYGPFVQTAYTGGFLMNFISTALGSYVFETRSDVDLYLSLLADVSRLLGEIYDRTEGQAARGIRIHRPQIPGVKELLTRLKAGAASGYVVAPERLSTIEGAKALSAEIAARVETDVLPKFDALVDQLNDAYAELAPTGVGMSELPGGDEVYLDLLKMHTTLDMTPEQVHQAGLDRMTQINEEKAALRDALDFKGTEAEFAEHVRKHPRAVAESAEDIGAKMRHHKAKVEARFDEFFSMGSPYDYDVARLDNALETSMTWGYYQSPTAADPRGVYYYNGSRLDSQCVIGAASLVFHELVPGHHLHLTLQSTNENLHPIRQFAFVNAFNEGWAEYAGTLAGEMGLYDDPYDRYGRLIMDSFFSSRLVVDTGMNALGWSLEDAERYMREHTLCIPSEISSDCLRYSCGIPGQSLAYKLGDEEILRFRDDIKSDWGEEFDYSAFHSAILNIGAVPLPTLEWHLKTVFDASHRSG